MLNSRIGLLIIILLFILIEYYAYVAVNTATKSMAGKLRIAILIVYALLSITVWISLLTFRSLHMGNMPGQIRAVLIAMALGWTLGKLVMAGFMIIDDIRRMITWIIQHWSEQKGSVIAEQPEVSNGISRSVFLSRSAFLIGSLIFGGFLYGITNRYRYQLKRLVIKLPNLPVAFKGMKIVQISDVHAGSFDDKTAVQEGIKMVMDQHPDLILITGDLVNNVAEEIEPYMDVFAQLSAPLGVYSVLGNHDYGDYVAWADQESKNANLEKLKKHQHTMGWRLLMNEHVLLERNGSSIALMGVENWGAKARFPKYGNLEQAYAGLTHENAPVKILLSHDPSHWDAQVRKKYKDIDLTLSGHTHGMQFGIELPWMKWSPVQYVYEQWAGLYKKSKQYLYVNRGYGFIGYRGRLGILPEITLIELQ